MNVLTGFDRIWCDLTWPYPASKNCCSFSNATTFEWFPENADTWQIPWPINPNPIQPTDSNDDDTTVVEEKNDDAIIFEAELVAAVWIHDDDDNLSRPPTMELITVLGTIIATVCFSCSINK